MARINIDDKLHRDKRFKSLMLILQSDTKALGVYISNLVLADEYVSPENPRALIPPEDFEERGYDVEAMFESGAAKIEHGFVYVMKAETQFAWRVAAMVAGGIGGKKRAANAKRKVEEQLIALQSGAHAEHRDASLGTLENNQATLEKNQGYASEINLPTLPLTLPLKNFKNNTGVAVRRDPTGDHFELAKRGLSKADVEKQVMEIFPNKTGFGRAWEHGLKGIVIDQENGLSRILMACQNFRMDMQLQKRPAKMIMSFASFIERKSWMEYEKGIPVSEGFDGKAELDLSGIGFDEEKK